MEPDSARPDEREGVINPAVARSRDGETYLLPRLVAAGDHSRIGLARVRFDADGKPVGADRLGDALEPREPYECGADGHGGGCEDPRITYVEPLGRYVMTYVALGPHGARVALAVSDDLRSWQRLGPVRFEPTPDPAYDVDWNAYQDKDGSLFPQPVRGPDGRPSLALLHRPMYGADSLPRGVADPRHSVWISYRALDDASRDIGALTRWRHHHQLLAPRYDWEQAWVGGGAPPVLTPHGWLIVYHGVQRRQPETPSERKPVLYRAGVLIADRDDPRRILYRSPEPVLAPEHLEEREGIVSNVVFPTALDPRDDGQVDVYYGMADARIGAARLVVPARLPGLARSPDGRAEPLPVGE